MDYPANMRRNLNTARWFIVDSVLFGLMQNKVTVQKWRTSLTSLIIASLSRFLFSLENEAVQYPASKCDPVARPAQL